MEKTLKEVCSIIQYGYTASAIKDPVGPKFLRITDIVPDNLDWDSVPYCELPKEKVENYLLKEGDIVIARTGATTGYAKLLKRPQRAVFASYLVRLRLTEEVDPYYIGAIVESNEYKQYIQAQMGGTAQPNANAQVLTSYPLILPMLDTQRRIASILSAYDDLIENNTRRIQILEEMAQRIYTEWFVNFRFPGHEKAKFVDSELGRIPSEWGVDTLANKASLINRGIAPKYDDESDCIVINQRCIRDFRLDLTNARRQSKAVPVDKMVREGDILINSTGVGTLGRVAQVVESIPNCTVDTHVTIVRPMERIDQCYWGCLLMAMQDKFEGLGAGTTGQTELSRTSIGDAQALFAPYELQDQFGSIIKPIRRHALILLKKNKTLRLTRDLLLPKLISGEIDVSEMPDPQEVAA